MIKYHNAADTAGKVIRINEVTPESRKSMQFLCLGCGKEMEAVLGRKREHHFRHKDIGDCNRETYLHRLAKRVLKYKFDTQPQFPVKFYVLNECSKSEQCEYKQRHNWQDCSSVVLKTVNLKEFYDTCEEEVLYKGFRADLMLTNSKKSEQPLDALLQWTTKSIRIDSYLKTSIFAPHYGKCILKKIGKDHG